MPTISVFNAKSSVAAGAAASASPASAAADAKGASAAAEVEVMTLLDFLKTNFKILTGEDTPLVVRNLISLLCSRHDWWGGGSVGLMRCILFNNLQTKLQEAAQELNVWVQTKLDKWVASEISLLPDSAERYVRELEIRQHYGFPLEKTRRAKIASERISTWTAAFNNKRDLIRELNRLTRDFIQNEIPKQKAKTDEQLDPHRDTVKKFMADAKVGQALDQKGAHVAPHSLPKAKDIIAHFQMKAEAEKGELPESLKAVRDALFNICYTHWYYPYDQNEEQQVMLALSCIEQICRQRNPYDVQSGFAKLDLTQCYTAIKFGDDKEARSIAIEKYNEAMAIELDITDACKERWGSRRVDSFTLLDFEFNNPRVSKYLERPLDKVGALFDSNIASDIVRTILLNTLFHGPYISKKNAEQVAKDFEHLYWCGGYPNSGTRDVICQNFPAEVAKRAKAVIAEKYSAANLNAEQIEQRRALQHLVNALTTEAIEQAFPRSQYPEHGSKKGTQLLALLCKAINSAVGDNDAIFDRGLFSGFNEAGNFIFNLAKAAECLAQQNMDHLLINRQLCKLLGNREPLTFDAKSDAGVVVVEENRHNSAEALCLYNARFGLTLWSAPVVGGSRPQNAAPVGTAAVALDEKGRGPAAGSNGLPAAVANGSPVYSSGAASVELTELRPAAVPNATPAAAPELRQ